MATLVVGPFYLSRALGLSAAHVGLAMAIGPVVAALAGMPAGRAVDRFGTQVTTLGGLFGIAAGCIVLSLAPLSLSVPGYVAAVGLITAHYALFQAANNTAVLRDAGAGQQGLVSGTLNLSRHLGLVLGTSLLGAVFSSASGARDVAAAPPDAVAFGMRATFGVAAALVFLAFALVRWGAEAVAAGAGSPIAKVSVAQRDS
jgi:MFS family permease